MDDTIPQRQCPDCKNFFPPTTQHFYASANGRNGLSTRCKKCHSTRTGETRRKNHNADRQAKHTQYEKARRLKDREGFNRQRRERDRPRRERIRAYERAYRQKHRDVFLERRKQYRQSVQGYAVILTGCRNRRAFKKSVQGTHTAQDVQKQLKAQKGTCYYCHIRLAKYHVDHIVPISRGGSNDPSNLVLACPHCNMSKGDKLLHEWAQGGRLL